MLGGRQTITDSKAFRSAKRRLGHSVSEDRLRPAFHLALGFACTIRSGRRHPGYPPGGRLSRRPLGTRP
jgi:hypothetical protein